MGTGAASRSFSSAREDSEITSKGKPSENEVMSVGPAYLGSTTRCVVSGM